MKINRLFEMVYILLDRDKVTAKELADHFEVSTRTIYRDVEDLSAAGIPIYMTKGKNGGIALLPEYVLNKTVLTEAEKMNILSALQSLNALDDSSVENTLGKLSSFFGEGHSGMYEIDFRDWGNLIEAPFEKAKQAILERKLLSFTYISSQNKTSQRTVEPYKLWFKARTWYLKGFCREKNAFRLFRFSRMRHVEITEETFMPRALETNAFPEQAAVAATTEVMMHVASDQAYRLLDAFLEEDVVQNGDGSFTVTMRFIEDEWLYGYILSFGPGATVIKPERIRRIIKERLQKSLAHYL